jgi:CheY-like chemotaxis protein
MDQPIVVVDDEPELLHLVRDVLEEEGLSVLPVDHPDQVVNVVTRVRPALFLVDLMLPGTDGVELARRLRESGAEQTPIVGMSASRGMLEAAERSSLFDETLPKPFELSQLLGCVERFVVERRSA